MIRTLVSSLFFGVACVTGSNVATAGAPSPSTAESPARERIVAPAEPEALTVERVIELFSALPGYAAIDRAALGVPLRSFNVQVLDRLSAVADAGDYEVRPADAATLREAMNDDARDPYARLCAMRYLLELEDAAARQMLVDLLAGDDPRLLHNAAAILRLHVDCNPQRQWGVGIMLQLLADDRLLGEHDAQADITSGDAFDDHSAVFDEICFDLGAMRVAAATPVLIDVVQRRPQSEGAAAALGVIGDPQAAAVLMDTLIDEHGRLRAPQARALGALRHVEAVPPLLEQVGQPEADGSRYHERPAIEALGAIGDARAREPLRRYLNDPASPYRSEARLALVQIESSALGADLVDLLRREPQRAAQGKVLVALRGANDPATVAPLTELAREAPDPWLRAQCVALLGFIGSDSAIDALIAILHDAPADLELQPGGQTLSLHGVAADALQRATGEAWGTDARAWQRWRKMR